MMMLRMLVIAQLLFLAADDPEKDISLYINSPGGSVTAGMGIYDTMQFIKPDVSTICVGMAASMGSLLLDGRCKRQAVCSSEQRSYDSSAAWRRKRSSIGYQNPCGLDYQNQTKT